MNRFQGLPFMNRGQQSAPGGAVPMQSSMVQQDPNFSSQHTYVPPNSQEPPPGQQYPPPAGLFQNHSIQVKYFHDALAAYVRPFLICWILWLTQRLSITHALMPQVSLLFAPAHLLYCEDSFG